MKQALRVSLAALCLSLAAGPLQAQQPATSAERQMMSDPQAVLAKARDVAKWLQALTPEQARQMPEAEALERYRSGQDIVLALTHVAYREVAMSQGQELNEAGFRRFLGENGVASLMAEENLNKFNWLSARLTPGQVEAVEVDLRRRYPAYDSYIRRALLGGVLSSLTQPRIDIANAYAKSHAIPAKQDPAMLNAVLKQKGVRGASYENGHYTVVLDERIYEGGVLDVAASPKVEGGIQWRCSGSKMPQNLLPGSCRP